MMAYQLLLVCVSSVTIPIQKVNTHSLVLYVQNHLLNTEWGKSTSQNCLNHFLNGAAAKQALSVDYSPPAVPLYLAGMVMELPLLASPFVRTPAEEGLSSPPLFRRPRSSARAISMRKGPLLFPQLSPTQRPGFKDRGPLFLPISGQGRIEGFDV